jgi:probable HAF family extracellular repeat protein
MSTPECFAGRLRRAVVVLALLFVVGRGTGAAAAPMYTVQDLGAPDDYGTFAYGINNSGQVVGTYQTKPPEANDHAFLYDNAGRRDLATLGGSYSDAYAINDAGQVVGIAATAVGRLATSVDGVPHAFLYDSSGMHDLTPMEGTRSWAQCISGTGQVAGWVRPATGAWHNFVYSGGVMQDLGTLGAGGGEALGINRSGQIVGHNMDGAFLYDSTGTHPLGSLGGHTSGAIGINDAGQVVGAATTAEGVGHAFLYDSTGMHDLGALVPGWQSCAYGLNAAGQVVGTSQISRLESHAVLWENGTIHDLNDLVSRDFGWLLEEARGINDLGQIICNGRGHAFLLTPTNALPPTSGASLFPLPNSSGWNTSDVTVSLRAAADSNDAGVISMIYGATGTHGIPATTVTGASASIRITTEGETTLTYYAKGKSGLAERTKCVIIRVDKTPPTTTATPSPLPDATGGYNGDVTVALSATDSDTGSGVASITYRTAGAQPSPKTTVSAASGTIRLTITAQGQTTLTYYASDNAGNLEAAKMLTIRIDKKSSPATSTSAGAPPAAYDDLCDLTRQFVANPKVANALCAKLQAAKAAAARGAKKAKKNAIAEFVSRVKKQKGKGLTRTQADTLIQGARAL